MINKKPSGNMKKMYTEKREATLKKIQDAIDEIHDDRRIVTKKELITITGISSGTFSQEHVKDLLEQNKVCQFRDKKKINIEKTKQLQDSNIVELNKENQRLLSKIQDFELSLEYSNNKNIKLIEKYEKLEYEHRLLKGKYQQLLEYLDALGADLDFLPLI